MASLNAPVALLGGKVGGFVRLLFPLGRSSRDFFPLPPMGLTYELSRSRVSVPPPLKRCLEEGSCFLLSIFEIKAHGFVFKPAELAEIRGSDDALLRLAPAFSQLL